MFTEATAYNITSYFRKLEISLKFPFHNIWNLKITVPYLSVIFTLNVIKLQRYLEKTKLILKEIMHEYGCKYDVNYGCDWLLKNQSINQSHSQMSDRIGPWYNSKDCDIKNIFIRRFSLFLFQTQMGRKYRFALKHKCIKKNIKN